MNIEQVERMLQQNNIPFNRTMGRTGENILFTHGLKSYLIQFEDNQCNLLEFNVACNFKRKPKYHYLDKYSDTNKMLDYISSVNFI